MTEGGDIGMPGIAVLKQLSQTGLLASSCGLEKMAQGLKCLPGQGEDQDSDAQAPCEYCSKTL